MRLNCILLSERSQSDKAAYSMISFIRYSGKSETIEMVNKTMVVRYLG